ncbi:uncharacterized protein L201_006198 [Kwoniella dendrophila CBS 6074]|uniref:Mid2 domain-containing protein n=1 Tax=Kwoniella dendrophila CBS 6074 TaxID=1295534 RepID=A0AAX4K0T9_9TREE
MSAASITQEDPVLDVGSATSHEIDTASTTLISSQASQATRIVIAEPTSTHTANTPSTSTLNSEETDQQTFTSFASPSSHTSSTTGQTTSSAKETSTSTLAEPNATSTSPKNPNSTSSTASKESTTTSPAATSSTTTDESSIVTSSSDSSSSSTMEMTQSSSSSIPPLPSAEPLFTSSSTASNPETTSFAFAEPTSSGVSSWSSSPNAEEHKTLNPSDLNLAHVQVDASSATSSSSGTRTSATTAASGTAQSSITDDPSDEPITTEITSATQDTFPSDNAAPISSSLTDADSAHSSSNSDTKNGGGAKMSSGAIVGIVAGILVGMALLYLIWYNWRKKKAREALLDDTVDPNDEKFSPTMMNYNRTTRSSFGAADPITPYTYRLKGNNINGVKNRNTYNTNLTDDDEDWFDPNIIQNDENQRRKQEQDEQFIQYDKNENNTANPFEDNLFHPTKPTSDGRTPYFLGDDEEEDRKEIRASLAEDLSPELQLRPRSTYSSYSNQTDFVENPFVPPLPEKSSFNQYNYSHNQYGGLNRHGTNKTVRTIPAVPDDVDIDDDSSLFEFDHISDKSTTYPEKNQKKAETPNYSRKSLETNSKSISFSRPQSEFSEPSTSNLLPWINKSQYEYNENVSPVPPLPFKNKREKDKEIKKDREPPRAMMSQTPNLEIPKGHGGELAEIPIPTFR